VSRAWRCLVGAVALSVLVGACGSGSRTEGARLPELELPSLDGDSSVQLDEVTGITVVNLWATWCAPCRRELPDFEEVHQAMSEEVRFIGVNIGDRPAEAARFIDELGVTFEQYLDFDGSLNEALSTATLPVTVVTDASGRITTTHSGPMDAAELIELIERARNAESSQFVVATVPVG
jgi:thiol-disulfide isomerase/thioredoxin